MPRWRWPWQWRKPPPDRPEEFWHEETRDERALLRRLAFRWTLVFGLLFGGVLFAFWWAGSAVEFSTSRTQQSTRATWRVLGTVRSAATGEPIPWAHVRDDPGGHPPHFEATADHMGNFELATIAEPHNVLVTAIGFRPGSVRVGRVWYIWMPRGEERVTIALEPEPKP
jgi:hypothetical protein